MKVKSMESRPLKQKDGTWTTIIGEFEEEIPDLGRNSMICNKCGWPDYPKCKETFCKAWLHNTLKTK